VDAIPHSEYIKLIDASTAKVVYDSLCATFQTLVSGLQVLKKSYTTFYHVKKILRSLPAKWRPKVTAIQEVKDMNDLKLENLISSLKCHELELMGDELHVKKSKSLALKSSGKSVKALQVMEPDEETQGGGSEE
ncbi:aspartyl-tRNA synthetase, partial [Trifolium medium]|nr:aspartyl-tRNA synthetase [Trifolium medium]